MQLSQEHIRQLTWWRKSTFLVMLFGYVGYYIVRQNLPAAFPLMEKTFGYSNAQLGMIAAVSEIAYAIGKLINGPLGDKIGGKKIFLIGLGGAIVCNVLFALGSTLPYFIAIWCLCRYFLSMGWGGIAKTIGAWFEPEKNGRVMGWISLNFQFGGVVATLFAGYLVSLGYGWDKLFIFPAAVACGVWLWSLYGSREKPQDVVPGTTFGQSSSGKRSLASFDDGDDTPVKQIMLTLLKMPVFRQLLFFSFITTLLRSIFLFWIPKFLVDIGMGASGAIFKSALFPTLGCLGTVLLGWYTDKYVRNGDRAKAMWIMLTGLVLSLAGIALLAETGASNHNLVVILTGLSGFFLLGPYSMTSGALTLDIAGSKGAGSCTGMLDGIGYFGGALAAWGAGYLSDLLGWSQVFDLLALLSLLAVGSAYLMSRHFQRAYFEEHGGPPLHAS
ncbi:MAG: MFS transporter [Candidatus Sericytochromatia bacterium]|nr:MFS transporter [Candidatus Sericytochromatia bacterium]